MTTTLEQQIRERAFHLWEAAGRPHGQADHHWISAEREIRIVAQPEARKAPAKKAATPKPATQARKAPSEVRA